MRENLVGIGDSITLGAYGQNENIQSQIYPLMARPLAIVNQGIPGVIIDTITPLITGGRLSQVYRANGTNIATVWAGTNNLYANSGDNENTTWTKLQVLCAAVRAAGFKIVLVTMLPRDWSAGTAGNTDTNRLAFNTLVRNGWSSIADALADVGADPTMGPTAAYSNLALYGDGVHPTPLGYSYLAPIITSSINSLLT